MRRHQRKTSRRRFLVGSATAGAGLALGFQLSWGVRAGAEGTTGSRLIDAWLEIDEDGQVTIKVGQSEMGQGVYTSVPMMIAEELEVPFDRVRFEDAGAGAEYRRPGAFAQYTGGSSTVRGGFQQLREVGAAARQLLEQAAALHWKVPAKECRGEQGEVVHAPSGRRLAYAELLATARRLEAPEEPRLKDPSEFRLIGKPLPRLDTPAKVDGSATFGIDVRVMGMRYAAVANCPYFGGRLASLPPQPAGTEAVVEVPGGVAVVSTSWWDAQRKLDVLRDSGALKWTRPEGAPFSNQTFEARAQATVDAWAEDRAQGVLASEAGEPEGQAVDKTLEASYHLPFLAHATMEPQNCTARVGPLDAEVWIGTQGQEGVRDLTAKLTGLPASQVTVHTTFLGGGFGRRFETDLVAQAVTLAKRLGYPVKVLWSREEDMRHDFYRPAATCAFKVGLKAGKVHTWENLVVSPSILARVFPLRVAAGFDPTAVEGSEVTYAVPHKRVRYEMLETPVPVGFWRSVGSSLHAFTTESMLDEAAAALDKDPLDLRLELLADHPRERALLEKVAAMSGWGRRLGRGQGLGIAIAESFGSLCAQVAEVQVGPDADLKVTRFWAALDCGPVVNPDTVRAQIESSVVFGLSAALWGKIDLEDGAAVQGNFQDDQYRVVRMKDCPEIEVHIMDSDAPMGGVGEPATPPVAPAVANAVFAATRKRIRRLPLVPELLSS